MGHLTFDEAVVQTTGQGLKLKHETRPITINRPDGDVKLRDLPARFLESTSGKVEQFCDAVQHAKINITSDYFQNVIVKECATSNYKGLPEPFQLRKEPQVPYTMQLIILTALPPDDVPADTSETYVHVFKHVYLHKNKVIAKECMNMCYGIAMMDRMGGKQIRNWILQPKFEKKVPMDQSASDAGYRFIRENGPESNNRNQFMEWTDTQIHTAGSPIENWQEAKVVTALNNYMRGRQSAKSLEYWPVHFEKFGALVFG